MIIIVTRHKNIKQIKARQSKSKTGKQKIATEKS